MKENISQQICKKRGMKKIVLILVCMLSALLSVFYSCNTQNTDIPDEVADTGRLYKVCVGDKWGYINDKGQMIIEPQFVYCNDYLDDLCFAITKDKRGLINRQGEFIVELSEDIMAVVKFNNQQTSIPFYSSTKGLFGIMSKEGITIKPAVYKTMYYDDDGTHQGYCVADTNGNWGYLTIDGKTLLPCCYNAVDGFNEGLMGVATQSGCGYVDTLGDWVIDSIYDDARAFGDGLARVKKDDQWFFINRRGNRVDIGIEYDEILTGFSCGRAFVKKDDQKKLISRDGKLICVVDADSVSGFRHRYSYAIFKSKGYYGLLDTIGNYCLPPQYDEIDWLPNGYIALKANNNWGFADSAGNIIVEPKHSIITTLGTDSAFVIYTRDTSSRMSVHNTITY